MDFFNTRRDVRACVEPGVFPFDALDLVLDQVCVQRTLEAGQLGGVLRAGGFDLNDGIELPEHVVEAVGRRRHDATGITIP